MTIKVDNMNYELLKEAEELIDYTDNKICNHCLGRKFSDKIKNSTNVERGILIREKLNADNPDECLICNNLFNSINEDLYNKILDKIKTLGLEFDTFLVGSKVPKEILEKDEEISNKFNFNVESIKKEINRIIGLKLEELLKREVSFENNDIVIEINFKKKSPGIYLQINPIFIEGTYNKYKRGIPQTKWPCRECHGRGCEYCNYTGKMYPESVEELISDKVLETTKGHSSKFHGAGREDVDVLMLGDGRPFVLEISEPKIRKIDLNRLEKVVNENAKGKTKYNNLKFCKRNRKSQIKVSSPNAYKVYEATVSCENDIDENDLKILDKLDLIKQRTPIRVSHRRADKIREKRVFDLKCEIINSKKFKMKIKTQGGLYIKELISSDEGRSNPSVSSLLNNKCICTQLNVIEVSKK